MPTNRRKSKTQYEARARIAKALAHPTRLLLMDLLAEQERCVGELTEAVGVDQSTVSKHLAILRQAGIVQDRRDGVMTYYRVKICCLERLFSCIESVLQQNLREHQAACGV